MLLRLNRNPHIFAAQLNLSRTVAAKTLYLSIAYLAASNPANTIHKRLCRNQYFSTTFFCFKLWSGGSVVKQDLLPCCRKSLFINPLSYNPPWQSNMIGSLCRYSFQFSVSYRLQPRNRRGGLFLRHQPKNDDSRYAIPYTGAKHLESERQRSGARDL